MGSRDRRKKSSIESWIRAQITEANLAYRAVVRLREHETAQRLALDDPELLLTQAQEQMKAMHARHRARAIEAISQKNMLACMVEDTERKVAQLHAKANLARNRGDEALASEVLQEMQRYEQTLAISRTQLANALATTEQVKAAIRREEEKIRLKTADMIALQTQWKLVQVEKSLTISLAQLTAFGDAPLTRERAGERHRRSRALVVEAITQKNYLASLAEETRRRAEVLREKADLARRSDDESAERLVLRELEQQEATLVATQSAHERADQITNRARQLLEEEAARFRAQNWDPAELTGPPRSDAANEDGAMPTSPKRKFLQRYGMFLIAIGVAIVLLLLSFL
jgi:phage shock protein A